MNERMNRWFSESMNQWVNESMIQQTNELMNLEWMNQWINESVNEGMNQWMDGWRTGWMEQWATPLLSYFFTERPFRWGTSSLRYLFSQLFLFCATSYLGNFFWPCSELPPICLLCSFCNRILLFAQLLQCVWQPPAAIPHSTRVALWSKLIFAQLLRCL